MNHEALLSKLASVAFRSIRSQVRAARSGRWPVAIHDDGRDVDHHGRTTGNGAGIAARIQDGNGFLIRAA